MKILWIDDDRLYVRPLADDLEDHGHSVERVFRADEGYEKISQNPDLYDLILVDVMMTAWGRFAVDEAKGGRRTGLVILRHLSEEHPELLARTKVVTVVSDPSVKKTVVDYGVSILLKSHASAESILE